MSLRPLCAESLSELPVAECRVATAHAENLAKVTLTLQNELHHHRICVQGTHDKDEFWMRSDALIESKEILPTAIHCTTIS